MKEFYSNLKLANEIPVVMVRGFEVSYSEGIVNMMIGLKNVEEVLYPKICSLIYQYFSHKTSWTQDGIRV